MTAAEETPTEKGAAANPAPGTAAVGTAPSASAGVMGEREPDASPQVSPSRTHTGEGGGLGASDALAGPPVADLQPGDVVNARRRDWPSDHKVTGTVVRRGDALLIADTIVGWLDGSELDNDKEITVISRAGGQAATAAVDVTEAHWEAAAAALTGHATQAEQVEAVAHALAVAETAQTSAGRGIGDDPRPAGHHDVSSVALAASAGATA